MVRDDGLDRRSLSITPPASVSVPSSSEAHVATCNEDIPLTTTQMEGKQDGSYYGRYDLEPNETTPLLYSMETPSEKSSSSVQRRYSLSRSKSFITTVTSSQTSLFIASLQMSLHSSLAFKPRSTVSGSFKQQSVTLSIQESDTPKITTLGRGPEERGVPAILAMWHVLNVIISSNSVLGMPFAIVLGGVAALPLILLVGFLDGVTSVLLIDCLYEITPKGQHRQRARESYGDIGAAVWGPTGGHVVDLIRISLSYCKCVLRIMVLGNTLKALLSSQVNLSLQEWCLVCTSALLLVVFIKSLSALAWLSMMAVLAAFIIFFLLLGFSLSRYKAWEWQNILFFDVNRFPISMGIVMYSYCGHTVFPAVEESMRNPQKYNTISHWAFSISTAMKFLVGLFCVLTFGSETQSIVLLNLSESNASILSKIASILVIINMYFSYPVNMFVVGGTVDILLLPKFPKCLKQYSLLWFMFTRVILVYSTLGIALALPRFGLLMSVIGSLLGVCITFIFPCVFHLKLKWKNLSWYHIASEVFIILFGVVFGVLGVAFSCIALNNTL